MDANRNTIRRAFEAWNEGAGSITDVFAPEMVWRIQGRSVASKEYASKQQLSTRCSLRSGRGSLASDPFRPVEIRGVYADGDTVIVLWNGRGTAQRRP